MVRPRVADRGDGLLIWREAANMLNKQSQRADEGWSSSLGFRHGANKSWDRKYKFLTFAVLAPGGQSGNFLDTPSYVTIHLQNTESRE